MARIFRKESPGLFVAQFSEFTRDIFVAKQSNCSLINGYMQEQEEQIAQWLEQASAKDVELVIDETTRFACKTFFDSIGACEGSVWWKYSKADYLEICYNSGARAQKIEGQIQQPLSEGIVSMVFHTGEAVYTNQLQSNPDHSKEVDRQLSQKTQNMIVAPVLLAGIPVAVISAVILKDDPEREFEFSDLEAIQHLAELLRSYWENQLGHQLF